MLVISTCQPLILHVTASVDSSAEQLCADGGGEAIEKAANAEKVATKLSACTIIAKLLSGVRMQ